MISPTAWLWIGFHLFIFAMLAMDLFLHRREKTMSIKVALAWSVFWVALAFAFSGFIFYLHRNPEPNALTGAQAAMQFITAYLVEESLSVDNLFIFVLIFNYFHIEANHQHRVLFWGILGAIICRALFILVGMELVQHFHWIIYIFGLFVIYTGISMLRSKNEKMDPEHNPVLKLARKFLPISSHGHGSKFFIRENGRRLATPLFVVLLVIESTDVMFATDSIPAVIAITQDRFIAYSSNIFAILGLRSLYFALAGMMDTFAALNYGLAIILIFIGFKMLSEKWLHIPISLTLGVITLALAGSIVASLYMQKKSHSNPTA